MTYPYHENANTGEMVPCSSNPCRLHSAEQHYMADNAEEAMQMKMERKGLVSTGGLSAKMKAPVETNTVDVSDWSSRKIIMRSKNENTTPEELQALYERVADPSQWGEKANESAMYKAYMNIAHNENTPPDVLADMLYNAHEANINFARLNSGVPHVSSRGVVEFEAHDNMEATIKAVLNNPNTPDSAIASELEHRAYNGTLYRDENGYVGFVAGLRTRDLSPELQNAILNTSNYAPNGRDNGIKDLKSRIISTTDNVNVLDSQYKNASAHGGITSDDNYFVMKGIVSNPHTPDELFNKIADDSMMRPTVTSQLTVLDSPHIDKHIDTVNRMAEHDLFMRGMGAQAYTATNSIPKAVGRYTTNAKAIKAYTELQDSDVSVNLARNRSLSNDQYQALCGSATVDNFAHLSTLIFNPQTSVDTSRRAYQAYKKFHREDYEMKAKSGGLTPRDEPESTFLTERFDSVIKAKEENKYTESTMREYGSLI